MLNARELQDLISFDMPHPTATEEPDFTKKCHYTLRHYTCTHRSFLPTPRITHVHPCLYTAQVLSPILSELSPNYPLNASKHRCGNMALKPKNISLNELCSNCRPSNLGVDKQLRPFEVLIPESKAKSDEKGKVRVASSDLNTSVDWGVSPDQIERALDPQTQAEIQAETKPETQSETRTQSQPALKRSPALLVKIPEHEPMLEQPSDSTISADTEGKRERWVDVCPSVENEEAALSAESSKKSIFSRIFSPFTKIEEAFSSQTELEQNAGEDAKVGENGGKGWISVNNDPDWEVVNDEERKEKKLWKDDGDWINIKQ